ncbi:uncharacterized protein LOC126672427 [Mercurialis annua]|uniref:uncharacterized protein LOC126672427 n=1 Tax=Mercurialis annua TaxID=3986 RepID=UPI00215ED15A|nr:uncharacterized protein LOC126672427 [Mercurialis annua]
MVGSYDIKYEPRTAMKARILVDYVAKTTTHDQPTEVDKGLVSWILQVDGAPNMAGAGAGMILRGPHKIKMQNSIHLNFPATNNSVEYEALIGGLTMATVVKAEFIKIQSDSQLVVNQVLELFEVKDPEMKKYVDRVKELLAKITEEGGKWELEQIPREENTEADTLAKAGAAKETVPVIPCSIQNFSSIQNPEATFLINLCLTVEEGEYVLAEMHEDMCGSHISHLALCRKAVLQGYDWPTMAQDAASLVQKCEKCQYHQNVHHQPITEQSPIISPSPFSTWGIDIVGPFPTASGQRRFFIVAVDHFSKWVEAEAVSTITEARVRRNRSKVHLGHPPQTNGMTERTTPKAGIGRTPYSLTYGCEAMVPVEIGMPTIRVQYFDEQQNEENTRLCLDLLKERREQALMHIEAYK